MHPIPPWAIQGRMSCRAMDGSVVSSVITTPDDGWNTRCQPNRHSTNIQPNDSVSAEVKLWINTKSGVTPQVIDLRGAELLLTVGPCA
jgi:hypothetical protein